MDSVRLTERSSAAVAVTSWRDQLYLAWTGTDRHVNVAAVPDGREIRAKQRLPHQSYRRGDENLVSLAPSLAASGEYLHLAWTADADRWVGRQPYVAIMAVADSPDGTPVEVDEAKTRSAPALCSHQGSLIVGWEDFPTSTWFKWADWFKRADCCVNILTGAGGPHGAPVRLDEAKTITGRNMGPWDSVDPCTGPALCSHQDSLILAWRNEDRRLSILTDPEGPHDPPVQLDEVTSYTAPALCSHQGSLILAWTDDDHRINILTDPEGPHDPPVQLDEAASWQAPALCSHQGSLILAWTSSDRRINLTRLR